MKEIILVKDGELSLKGLNRATFESKLVNNIKRRLKPLGEIKITRAQSTMYIEPISEDFDFEEALMRVGRIFGIAGYSRACVLKKTPEDIFEKAPIYLEKTLKKAKTFKVEAKRADKSFPLKSPEICMELGGVILSKFNHLKVDVHNPDVTVTVEVRDFAAYVRAEQLKGAGGLPVGTSGKAEILISG